MSTENYFERHEAAAFILKAVAVILLVVLVKNQLERYMTLIFLLSPVIFLVYARIKAAAEGEDPMRVITRNMALTASIYSEGNSGRKEAAWSTYSIIFVNVIIFYGFEMSHFMTIDIMENLIFLPVEPNLWNVPVSAVTSVFLHASDMHLWGNMVLLWAVGTAVEKRTGAIKFLALYMVMGVISGLVSAAVWYFSWGVPVHAIGSSGAIAGIMGIYAMGYHFKTMVFPIPILAVFSLVFPISLKVRLNAIAIIGLFFLMDLSGGLGQIAGQSTSNMGHWANLAGMLSGVILSMILGLGKGEVEDGEEEAALDRTRKVTGADAKELSLRKAIDQNPDNPDAALHLARVLSKHHTTDEGRVLYKRAMANLIKTRPAEAADAFVEYSKLYKKGVDAALMHRIAGVLFTRGDFEAASRALELLVDSTETPAAIKEKALFQCAFAREKMNLPDEAVGYYERFVAEYPRSMAVEKAKASVKRLKGG